MSEQDDREAIETARDLGRKVGLLAGEVRRLRSYGRRSRWFIALDIILTVGVGAFGYLSVHAGQDASAEHSSLVASCQSGNQTRAQERALWEHLASLSRPAPAATPAEAAAQRRSVAGLLAYVDKTFAPKDCQQVYRLP